ncbi:MAG: MinD/ParA family protein, partial [Gammaproteobacteria bacterium]|nr:MinD/ParA family protein [Gammaproteobacteria bacterium]
MHLHSINGDQAAGLRKPTAAQPVRVIAITGGKGGVGKTMVSINLALALAARNRRVMLLDADLGLANVDVLLGLQVERNLSHVMEGSCNLDDIILDGPGGIKVVPASSGARQLASTTPAQNSGLIWAFSEMTTPVDDLVIDTAAGIVDSVIRFSSAAQEVVVVVCDEPASITDAYALIKVLSRDHGVKRFNILANKTRGAVDGRELFEKISKVAQRFLEVSLSYIGHVPHDSCVRKAIQRQCGVVDQFPASRAAKAFDDIASQ